MRPVISDARTMPALQILPTASPFSTICSIHSNKIEPVLDAPNAVRNLTAHG